MSGLGRTLVKLLLYPVILIAATILGGADAARPSAGPRVALAQEASVDPKVVSLIAADLPEGFALNPDPDKTRYSEREGGILVYETGFIRDRTPRNLASGPIEVKNLVARTTGPRQAAEQFTNSRRALLESSVGWAESPAGTIGDESVGLSVRGDSADGRAVAHLFLFRTGAMVAGITIAGLETATPMAEAESLAAIVLRRIEQTTASQRATDVPRLAGTPSSNPDPGPIASAGTPTPTATPARQSARAATSTPTAGPAVGASPSAEGPTAPPASATNLRVANTGGANLHLRSAPATSAAEVALLPPGTVLEVIGQDREAEGRTWKNVRAAAYGSGWVAADYTAAASAATQPSPPAPPAGATATPTQRATPQPTDADGADRAALDVDVVPRFAELVDGPQTLDIRVTRRGRPIADAVVEIDTVPPTSAEPLAASPTDANGAATVSWVPDAPPGVVAVGVVVIAPDGATGADTASFILTSRP
jgi:hypothetical protein